MKPVSTAKKIPKEMKKALILAPGRTLSTSKLKKALLPSIPTIDTKGIRAVVNFTRTRIDDGADVLGVERRDAGENGLLELGQGQGSAPGQDESLLHLLEDFLVSRDGLLLGCSITL